MAETKIFSIPQKKLIDLTIAVLKEYTNRLMELAEIPDDAEFDDVKCYFIIVAQSGRGWY
jgi:hypothetical protein